VLVRNSDGVVVRTPGWLGVLAGQEFWWCGGQDSWVVRSLCWSGILVVWWSGLLGGYESLLVRNAGDVVVRTPGWLGVLAGQEFWWCGWSGLLVACVFSSPGSDLAGWLSGKTAWRVYEASVKPVTSPHHLHNSHTQRLIT